MEERKKAILDYINALKELKKLRVLTNQKDFTGQIGEWVASIIYKGDLAKRGNQKGWDFISNNEKYQVKASAKSNSNKDSDYIEFIDYINEKTFDYLIIIPFTEEYKIKELYKIQYDDALEIIRVKSKSQSKNLNFSWIKAYKEDLQEINKQHQILSVFFD